MRIALILLLATAGIASASIAIAGETSGPEIQRASGPPQAIGVAHTLRVIPEACARLEGVFTGDASLPYKLATVRTSPNCQPRARFVDAAKAQPSKDTGWKFNDVIRVPSVACPSQQAVVKVWRKPGDAAPPTLDAQGRARLYLKDSMEAAAANKTASVPMFAAVMTMEGKACD